MNTIPVTESMVQWWLDQPNVIGARPVTMAAPEGHENHVIDCEAIATVEVLDDGTQMPYVRTPWKPNEIEVAMPAKGGTLWLSTAGGLPPHHLLVQPSERDA